MSTTTVSFKAPKKQLEKIDQLVEEKGYTSRGEFLRDIIRREMEPELTEEAVERIENAREQLKKGEGKSIEEI